MPELRPDGFVKSINKVDPMTGTTTDAITSRPHQAPPVVTRFDFPEDLVQAEKILRARAEATGNPLQLASIDSLLGPDGHTRMTGLYIDPANPAQYLSVSFHGGDIIAVFDRQGQHNSTPVTMYPSPPASWCPNPSVAGSPIAGANTISESLMTFIRAGLSIDGAVTIPELLKKNIPDSASCDEIEAGLRDLIATRALSALDWMRLTYVAFDSDDELYDYLGKLYGYIFRDAAEPSQIPD